MQRWLAGLFVVAAAAGVIWLMPQSQARDPRPLQLTASKVRFSVNDETADRIGRLKWRGTIRLVGNDKEFGGLSGLVVSKDGSRFLAITDQAHWVTGTFSYDGKGNLTGATGGTITPMLDQKGNTMSGKSGDAEALAPLVPNDPDGPVVVAFEGDHRVWVYDPPKDGQRTVKYAVTLPDDAKALPGNGGIEALSVWDKTSLLAFGEYTADKDGNLFGWTLPLKAGAKAEEVKAMPLKPVSPFAITDACPLPDGSGVLLAERRFSRETGVGFQVRMLSNDAFKSGPAQGEVLANLGMSFVIDNMEGISARTGEKGETLIYVVADDNFNRPIQQTLVTLYELLPADQ